MLNGRRVTREEILAAIVAEHYFTAADGVFGGQIAGNQMPRSMQDVRQSSLGVLTFCVLTLKNGFTVTGQSACADPTNYDQATGERLAYNEAVSKIWPLLGYALCEQLAREKEQTVVYDKPDGWERYICQEEVEAIPMSRAVYNDFRGWTMPADEQDDDGYLVLAPGPLNVDGYNGHITWVPSTRFERAYRLVGKAASASEHAVQPKQGGQASGGTDENTFIDRLIAERAQLKERLGKLQLFLKSTPPLMTRTELELLRRQAEVMQEYLMLLETRMSLLMIVI